MINLKGNITEFIWFSHTGSILVLKLLCINIVKHAKKMDERAAR